MMQLKVKHYSCKYTNSLSGVAASDEYPGIFSVNTQDIKSLMEV